MAMRASCSPLSCVGRWMRPCASASSRKHEATRWRCWSYRGSSPPQSWRASSGCRAGGRCRAGSRRTSWRGSRPCRWTRSGCCWSPRRSRPVTRRSCGARRRGSASAAKRWSPRSRRGCSRSAPGCGFAIRWCARRCTERDPRRTGARRIGRWPKRATRRWIPTDAPGTSPRRRRALAAARAKHLAGAPDAALRLLATAEVGGLDELGLARVDMLRAQIAYAQNRGRDAPPLLLRAAKRLERLDVTLARSTYLEALSAAFYLQGRSASSGRVMEVAQAALAAPKPDPPHVSDLLLDGLATRFIDGYAGSAPTLKRALAAIPSADISSEEALRWLWLATQAAVNLWDDQMWEVAATRYVQLARHTGVLPVLPLALNGRIAAHTFAGELAAAAALVEEARAISEATGSHIPAYGALILAAWRGREEEATRLIEATMTEALVRGEAYAVSTAEWARAVLYNGLGRYQDALAAAERASEHTEDLWFYNWGLVELIVAAARSGKPALAANALERLSEMTRASGTEWALGIEARSRAILTDGHAAERLYREGIDRLQRTRIRVELARTHLLYGEWLRRERRPLDAREQLRTAREMFTSMGAEAFAARAERELLATCERAPKRVVETRDDLTAQEAQIARLAGEGLSNPEIGARLFISPRTVEYHLHKVFNKLGISSRHDLPRALATETTPALTA